MSNQYDNNDVPFDQDDADDEISLGGGIADGKSVQKVIDETTFPPVPRGRNDFFVKSISLYKDAETSEVIPKQFTTYVDDGSGTCEDEAQYESLEALVTYALVSDPRLTVRETHRFPPMDPDQQDAYLYGSGQGKKPGNGFWYNRLKLVLAALGHEVGEDGTIPSLVPAQWKKWPDGSPRIISLDIGDQTRKNDETGKYEPVLGRDGKPYSDIKMWSYRQSEDTVARLNHAPPPKAPAAPRAPAAAPKAPAAHAPAAPAAPRPPAAAPRPPAPAAAAGPRPPAKAPAPPPPAAGPKPPGKPRF